MGIGADYRPHDNTSRNRWWRYTVAKHGYEVGIVAEGLTWAEACDLERQLIARLRADPEWGPKCVNLTDGGEGTKGWNKDPRNAEWLANVRNLPQNPKWQESRRKLSQDPKWRANNAAAMRKQTQDPEYRANMSRVNKASVKVALTMANLNRLPYTCILPFPSAIRAA